MKVPSIFLFVNGKAMGRSNAQKDNIKNLIGKDEEIEESGEEDIDVVVYKEETVKPVEEKIDVESEEEEIDAPLWTDLNSFLGYVKPLGCVLVLLCNKSPVCTSFKAGVWSDLIRENENIRFLDVDIQDTIGSKIVKHVKASKLRQKEIPAVILFCDGSVKGHSLLKKSKIMTLINYINKKKK